ncbi:hypothetical protein [Roseiflexus castenholzii]|jgi:hypothetical protein|uniref:Uncharacterized protein n=1 Tax=Roseiflexus castenholzii (strain DSM 13941 / HLO8) TaxID=383372 RepID=A7NHI8_ROSCS|nr:hypothetical protein [Roseiflexus castenholzii]ABU56935.1 hypothetical protein Rcas_0818 [Roseiflexus castenholzii DSM 13941]
MLPALGSVPPNHRLTAMVNRLLDEELARLSGDQESFPSSLPPSARAAIIEIAMRTLERLNWETCQSSAGMPVVRQRNGSR